MQLKILTCIKHNFCKFCEWIVFQKKKEKKRKKSSQKQNETFRNSSQNAECVEKTDSQNQVYKKSIFQVLSKHRLI